MLANFEFAEKSFLLKSEVLKLADNEAKNSKDALSPLSPKSLTIIMSDIWNGKVRIVRRRVDKQKQLFTYSNLKKRTRAVENSDLNGFETLMRLTPPAGWVMVRNNSEFSYLKLENKSFHNQRQVSELTVKLSCSGEITCGLKRNGFFVEDLKKHLNIGTLLEHLQTHEQVTLFLELFSCSSPCSGITMDAGEEIFVAVPHVIGNYQDLGTDQRKIVIFAAGCKLISLKGHSCLSCCHLKKVFTRRKKRKQGKANGGLKFRTNKRFLTRDEILLQLKKVQSEKRNAEKKAQFWKEKFMSLSNEIDTNSSDDQDDPASDEQ